MDQSRWMIGLGVLLGLALGLGVFTFGYAKGGSYLTDNPDACANCHVMREQFDGWRKASHHRAAVCNDCHTPPGLVPKYFTKALNGFNHSWRFTTGWYPDTIEITGRNARVTNGACIKCHEDITVSIRGVHRDGKVDCVTCHHDVGHVH